MYIGKKKKYCLGGLLGVLIIIILGSSTAYSQRRPPNSEIAAKIVEISGTVRANFVEKKEKRPVSSTQIIFQRIGCSACLISVRTNLDGEYSVSLGRGRYKVYVFGFKYNRLVDILYPSQSRIVSALYSFRPTTFDIELKPYELIDGSELF